MRILIIIFLMMTQYSVSQNALLSESRRNCVKIIIPSANISGTGFFLTETQIVTCLHVVAKIEIDGQMTTTTAYKDIKVVLFNNDTIDAICLTLPSDKDPAPLVYDFAVLQLKRQAKFRIIPNTISQNSDNFTVGDDVIFSGYPLSVPTMITHKGMISGITLDSNIICIQASINKGNSGGALLDSKGFVIGIISMREGAISQGLAELNNYISETEKHGGVQIMGVNPLQSTKEIINIVDRYISTGIGYAINIKHLKEYIRRNNRK